MTIDEAIAHAKEVAEENRINANGIDDCIECAEEHEQLAKWLEELKELRKMRETIESNAECLVQQGRADAIEFISDKLIFPLLNEYDRVLWEHISYIKLAKEWINVLNDNPYPKVKNYTEARKRDLRQWILEKLKEQK